MCVCVCVCKCVRSCASEDEEGKGWGGDAYFISNVGLYNFSESG